MWTVSAMLIPVILCTTSTRRVKCAADSATRSSLQLDRRLDQAPSSRSSDQQRKTHDGRAYCNDIVRWVDQLMTTGRTEPLTTGNSTRHSDRQMDRRTAVLHAPVLWSGTKYCKWVNTLQNRYCFSGVCPLVYLCVTVSKKLKKNCCSEIDVTKLGRNVC